MPTSAEDIGSEPFYRAIIERGEFRVVQNFSRKNEFVNMISRNLVGLIEAVVGKEAADGVRKDGLTSIHRYVDPDRRIELQDKLSELIKVPMLELSYELARERLGLDEDFYLDLMVISRIHFPFDVARKSGMSYMDYSKKRGRTTFKMPPELTSGYHKNLPFPAWAHGPHADSWFGHSYDGINLWWGVDGVTERSGMTFYPDYVGDNSLPVHEEPPYLAKNHPLPKPMFFNINPGDVIVFNSDTLHGTRVNYADLTRVSISTRINPSRPRFNTEQFRHVKLWLHSKDLPAFVTVSATENLPTIEESHKLGTDHKTNGALDSLIFTAPKEDPGSKTGVYGNSCKKLLRLEMRTIELPVADPNTRSISVCPSSGLGIGEKILVRAAGREIVLARTSKGLRALSAICPHVGYNLAAGGHDDEQVFCNGHGLAFRWDDGLSDCRLFRARTYRVEEQDGMITLHFAAMNL